MHRASNGPVLVLRFRQEIVAPTLDTVRDIFKHFGKVEKIIFFDKQETSALIQLESAEVARRAKEHIGNSKKCYAEDGSIRYELKVEYSTNTYVIVSNNCAKSWDYTTSHAVSNPSDMSYVVDFERVRNYRIAQNVQSLGKSPVLHVSNLHFKEALPQEYLQTQMGKLPTSILFDLFDNRGYVKCIKIIYRRADEALVQFRSAEEAEFVRSQLQNVLFFGRPLKIKFSHHQEIHMASKADAETAQTVDYSGYFCHRYGPNARYVMNRLSNSLEVRNINPSEAICPIVARSEFILVLFPPHLRGSVRIRSITPTAGERRVVVTFLSIGDALTSLAYGNSRIITDGPGYVRVVKISFAQI